jgi:predicted DsbA family dithiol-disulfide isomerase
MSAPAVRLIVYSDYLCPWCYLAEHRLVRLQAELGPALELEWRSFLLRPRPEPGRDLHRFVRYTQSWLRPAAEPEAPVFRVWESSEGPPTHSVPAHLAAKAAAALGADAFAALHARLLRAYFEESRDISRAETLRALWSEAGLPPAAFETCTEPALLERTIAEHNEAVSLGVTGVPAVRVTGTDAFVTGAQPLETYRRWIERLRAGVLDEAS